MRRARLDLVNQNDQRPVECMPSKNPKCATIVKLTTTLQDLMKDSQKQRLERIVCNDITHGKESNPIQCVNDLDEANEPDDYTYVKHNIETKANDILKLNYHTRTDRLVISFFMISVI